MHELLIHLRAAAPLLVMLAVTEGLLSVDNMLAIAALASELPEDQERRALRLGMLGAYVFRGLALAFATLIVRSRVMMVAGAVYLLHLAAAHFTDLASSEVDPDKPPKSPRTFWRTVVAIQFLDLSLSLDNVVVAVGVAPGHPWVVYAGVALGLVTLWMFATFSLVLIKKFPVLQHAAFLLIGYVGILLLVETLAHREVGRLEKFAGSVAVIVVCLIYGHFPRIRRVCAPVLKFAIVPLRACEGCVNLLTAGPSWLWSRIMAAFRKRA